MPGWRRVWVRVVKFVKVEWLTWLVVNILILNKVVFAKCNNCQ